MIEMSASGGLLADFALAEASGREFVLHVIKPSHPLPLAPDFYLGRIDALTLMAMGYRDAVAYLSSRSPAGVAADYTCTAMTDPPTGVRWREKLTSSSVGAVLTVWLPTEPGLPASVTGFLESPDWEYPAPLANGVLIISDNDGSWSYAGQIRRNGQWQEVSVKRDFRGGGTVWHRRMEASLSIGAERYDVHLGMADAAALLASLEPFGAHGVFQRAAAVAAVLGKGIRGLAAY
ncbi:hypothetical protein [Arthrobacter psychrolactophilus]